MWLSLITAALGFSIGAEMSQSVNYNLNSGGSMMQEDNTASSDVLRGVTVNDISSLIVHALA